MASPQEDPGPGDDYRAITRGRVPVRWMAVDIAAIFGVAAVLWLVYFRLPRDLQLALALDHQDPSLWAFWTTVLVHEVVPGHTHLVSNLQGFLTIALAAWLVFLTTGNRAAYWQAAVIMVFPGAVLVNLLSYLVYRLHPAVSLEYSYGFSAIVGEFTGFLVAGLLTLGLTLAVAKWRHPVEFSLWAWTASHLELVVFTALGTLIAIDVTAGLILVEMVTPDGRLIDLVGHGAGLVVGLVLGYRSLDFQAVLPAGIEVM